MFTTTNYIVAGSDDPTRAYPLMQPSGASFSGTNTFAYNYHQTAATAKALMDDIGSANVHSISGYLKASNSFESYTGRKSSPFASFPLVPGRSYYVRVFTTVNYIPSHY